MLRSILILIVFLLSACRTGSPSGEARGIRIGMQRPPDSFHPYITTTAYGETITARLFPGLFIEHPLLESGLPKLEPNIVAGFRWDEAGTTLELDLKADLHWSDGQPLSTEDVAYSLKTRRDPEVAWLSSPEDDLIADWEVVSPARIRIRFHHRSPFNLVRLNEGRIIPKHYFEQWPVSQWRERDWSADLVVFGPYRLQSYQPGERLLLEPMDAKAAARLGFAFVRDKESLYQLLLKNELDVAWPLPVDRIPQIRSRLQPLIFDDLSFAFIGWNLLAPEAYARAEPQTRADLEELVTTAPHPLFADHRVRRAMGLAMNRVDYLRRFWFSDGQVPASPWQAGLAYVPPQHRAAPYDPARAGQLLDEAGWVMVDNHRQKQGVPFRFSVICNTGSTIRESYLLAIQRDLLQIGIRMEVELQEAGLYISNCTTRRFDAYFGIFRTGTRSDLTSLYHGDAALQSGYNWTSWLTIDEPLERYRDAETVAELQAALIALEDRFQEEQPLTLLYKGQQIGAAAPGYEGALSNYLDPLFRAETWPDR